MTAPASRKPVIGLIGGIGSGKSTVARMFASLGCAVIDADALARDALERMDVRAELTAWWGPRVLDESGHVKRGEVARIVFSDPRELERLEALTHPIVHADRARLRVQYQADPRVIAIVEDCPLLLEKNLAAECDAVVYVQASDATRRRRVMATRGWSAEDLALREKRQMALDMKARRADYVVENDGSEAESLAHVRRVLSQILKRPT
jgi:dephospho-CoA kinase